MGFYTSQILPHLTNCACGSSAISAQRRDIVGKASGVVLEIGMGPGHNLRFYKAKKIERIIGLEPAAEMRPLAAKRIADAPFTVEWLQAGAEAIPLSDNSIDTVVLTYTLCTIPQRLESLEEMRRVLKPGCKLLFCEHGLAPDKEVRLLQSAINPMWKHLAGGCHLNIDIPGLIREGGFRIEDLDCGYVNRPKFATFHYRGAAST